MYSTFLVRSAKEAMSIGWLGLLLMLGLLSVLSCSSANSKQASVSLNHNRKKCEGHDFNYHKQTGCDGRVYPDPNRSPYSIPFPGGTKFKTGLTNCSSSYHAEGQPDRYAFDFNVDEGTEFYVAREGIVAMVINDQPSAGGGGGNAVVIAHGDNTYGVYLHAPKNGILVKEGDTINDGQLLGVTGKSGLAGYPHLHFIVVNDSYRWPYDPVPITFNNIIPADVIVKSNANYTSCQH